MSLSDRLTSGTIETETQRGRLDLTRDGGEFTDVVVDAPIDNDWSRVFRIFNKDPAEFSIVDDTVRERMGHATSSNCGATRRASPAVAAISCLRSRSTSGGWLCLSSRQSPCRLSLMLVRT